MNIVLFIPTASVDGDKPTPWLKQRLDAAVDYALSHTSDQYSFIPAGRWNNVLEQYPINEAEVCKRYILSRIPEARIYKEDISVDTAGGYAFAKPLIAALKPDKVIVFNSTVLTERNKFLAKKIFDPAWQIEFVFVFDIYSQNPRAQAKEPKALAMFQKIFAHVKDGDDQSIREILLYKTPFYYRDIINDKEFFNANWPGGFADFVEKRKSINNE